MQYALLIFDAPDAWNGLSTDEADGLMEEYAAIAASEGIVEGAQLQPPHTATTVRVEDGRALSTDGPFADTKEVFGGYFVLDAPDLDAALAVAARIPATRMGGGVEVRPLVERQPVAGQRS